MCPSAPMQEGSLLLGVVGADGGVQYLPEAMAVTREFVEVASQGRPAEQRFRFSSPCLSKGCGQWQDGRCSIADVVNELSIETQQVATALPTCIIRATCRWHQQNGDSVCYKCRIVVTDQRMMESDQVSSR